MDPGAESVDLADRAEFSRAPGAPNGSRRKTPTAPAARLSSAIAAGLAKGRSLAEAVREAKAYVTAAIKASDRLKIGHGHGPVHHFHHWWGEGKDA